jgi:hypothetical protein
MAITAADVESMIAGAAERVRKGWMPPRSGSPLSTQISDDMPALTTGIVRMYLDFYSWLWTRETPPKEASQVIDRITTDSLTAFARMDYAIRHGVLARCALWTEIQERPQEDQVAIREFLGQGIAPGSYPELEASETRTETQPDSSEGAGTPDAMRDWVVRETLRVQRQTGPSA